MFERSAKNKIGQGGQGAVFRGEWHGEDVAIKSMISTIENTEDPHAAMEKLKENISEVYNLRKIATDDRNQFYNNFVQQ